MVESLPTLPDLGAPSVDAHAHLDMLEDPAAALVRAVQAGIALVATVVDLSESPETTLEGLAGWLRIADGHLAPLGLAAPDVRIIAGWHPHNAKEGDEAMFARLRELAADPRVGAFGELGLDFHYDHSPRDVQRAWFRRQLELAHEVGLPVEIHLREAHDEGLALLAEVGAPPAGCVIHCFTEGPELAERFLDLGCHISFAGPVTFKKADEIRGAVALVPTGRLLSETDCPFMAPEPYRGRRNEPALTVFNALRIAEVRDLPAEEFALRSTENARRVFGGVK
jgi:TatD DNase family protein